MQRWHRDGLASEVTADKLAQRFELDLWDEIPVRRGPVPPFEERILETTDEYKVWVDELGALRKDFLVQREPGFVTRSWLKFPVESRADFLAIRERFDPASPERFPADWSAVAERLRGSHSLRCWRIASFFWQIRDWLGFWNICTAIYDQPDLLREMVAFVADYIVALFECIRRDVSVDVVFYNEDMAYKHAPMIGPAHAREFLLEGYRRISTCFERAGVRFRIMDCDGQPDELLPIWQEAGLNAFWPMEIAAGCDPVRYAREHPRLMLMGGVDKRALAQDRAAIRRALERLLPLVDRGGFVPTVDHAIPADVPYDNMCYYIEMKRKLLLER